MDMVDLEEAGMWETLEEAWIGGLGEGGDKRGLEEVGVGGLEGGGGGIRDPGVVSRSIACYLGWDWRTGIEQDRGDWRSGNISL